MKLNRSYKLLIQNPPVNLLEATSFDDNGNPIFVDKGTFQSGGFTEIDYPLTVEFSIERTTSSSLNSGTFSIINLAQQTQEILAKDMFNNNDFGTGLQRRKVIFQAGYQELSTIFVGDLLEGWTERNDTEIITRLRCQDGAYEAYNSYTNTTFQGSTSMNDIFNSLLQNLGLQKGVVGNINENQNPIRGAVYNGNTFELLRDNFNNRVFIDLDQVNLLGDEECILGQVPVISSQTGLLGVPKRQDTYIIVDIIFEPRIVTGQIIEIQSDIDPRFNGQWKVQGIKHSGTISGAVGGDCKTTLQLFYGTAPLNGLKVIG